MKSGGVKDIDRGWKRIKKEMEILDKGTVKVGILSDAPPPEKGDMNMAKLAAIQEFGWQPSNIPSRPFMRMAFDNNIDRLNSFIMRTKSMVLSGKIDALKAFNMLGVFFSGLVRETIKNGDFVPNARSTLLANWRKHHMGVLTRGEALQNESFSGGLTKKPLIDSGRMRDSITHEVELK